MSVLLNVYDEIYKQQLRDTVSVGVILEDGLCDCVIVEAVDYDLGVLTGCSLLSGNQVHAHLYDDGVRVLTEAEVALKHSLFNSGGMSAVVEDFHRRSIDMGNSPREIV
jgi:hypothetical protein